MKLHLLRHVETVNNLTGLTQPVDCISCDDDKLFEFIENTNNIIDKLGNRVLLIVANSLRSTQTAEPLIEDCKGTDHELYTVYLSYINEVNFGDFIGNDETFKVNGLSMEDYRKLSISYELGFDINKSYPNGESFYEISDRVDKLIEFINEIKRLEFYDDIVIIGHCRFFRHLLVRLKHVNAADMFTIKLEHRKLNTIM